MEYKDFYSNLFERYSGSDKLRGIWYHGTSAKYLNSILSQGLIPYPKEQSWNVDTDASQTTVDRTTYGGIYVTKNLLTSYSAAWRTAQKTKSNRIIVIMDLQSKSLLADEDDISFSLKQYPETVSLWYFKVLKYSDDEMDEYIRDVETQKEKWADEVTERICSVYEIDNPKIKSILKDYLKKEGFLATITRTVSYSTNTYGWHRYWDISKIKAEEIPNLPSKQEGELIFRKFVSKLTKLLKLVVNKNSFAPKGRSLQPIRFSGSNRIIGIVELIEKNSEPTKIKLLYGTLPQDFIAQYKERINNDFDPEIDVIK